MFQCNDIVEEAKKILNKFLILEIINSNENNFYSSKEDLIKYFEENGWH